MRSVGEQLGVENHDLDQEETLENITCSFEGRRTFVVVSSPAHHRAWDDAVIQVIINNIRYKQAMPVIRTGQTVSSFESLLDGVHKSTKMKTTGGRSPLFATLDSGFDEVCYGGASSLNPWRHIWTVFFETGCPIWSRREPPC
ncbi:hypothetical protein HZH68_001189 [Vespula germanica]|uniref:Uncharacterized protein n=1 Tax=Vespula germanica TaxID=30212 RepID=A0A834NVB1_VESGE|nr:hypothetical protein HZH68_001189 [Vespula germanica]